MKFWRRVRQGIKANTRACLQLIAKGPSRDARVLTYHSVDDSGSIISVTRSELRDQLKILRDLGIRGLTAAEYVDRKTPGTKTGAAEKEVLLTFDDGYENFLTDAMPLLLEYGYPATVFIVPEAMGQIPCWYERDAKPIEKLVANLTSDAAAARQYLWHMRPLASVRLMSWEQTQAAVSAGMDVSSHSSAHHFLTALTDEQLVDDLHRSRQVIRERLGVPAEIICYPYGDCDARVAAVAKTAGYRVGFRVDPSSSRIDNLQLGRLSVGPGMQPNEFRYFFSRACELEEYLRRRLIP